MKQPEANKTHHLEAPIGGLNRKFTLQRQAPYSSPDMLNVWPHDVLESRLRLGTRPGLGKTLVYQGDLANSPTGYPWRMMADLKVTDTYGFTVWEDDFNGTALQTEHWEQAAWCATLPPVIAASPSSLAFVTEAAPVAAVLKGVSPPVDLASVYSMRIYCVPWQLKHHGYYRLFGRMDTDAPNVETNGIDAELKLSGELGAYSGRLRVYKAGVLDATYVFIVPGGPGGVSQAGWFQMVFSGDNVKCWWQDVLLCDQDIAGLTGARMGFGAEVETRPGICLIDMFQTQWYAENKVTLREIFVGSANGVIYKETELDKTEYVPTVCSLAADRFLMAVPRGEKLYIADWDDYHLFGNDGVIDATGTQLSAPGIADWSILGIDAVNYICVITQASGAVVNGSYAIAAVHVGHLELATSAGGVGNCAYEIMRGAKVYDPIVDTLELYMAETDEGQVPPGMKVIELYHDRIITAVGRNYYMSRVGNPYDWNYEHDLTDEKRAYFGQLSQAGQLGDEIIGVAPYADDLVAFLCQYSTHIMHGDPASGGMVDRASAHIGGIDRKAWCYGPSKELAYLARGGLFRLLPASGNVPQEMSGTIPDELRDIDPLNKQTLMEYDWRNELIHIYIAPTSFTEYSDSDGS